MRHIHLAPARSRDKPLAGLERNKIIGGRNLTVAIAARCWWEYPDGSTGWALVSASERMLTTADTQHAMPTLKVGFFGSKSYALASGAMQVHSHLHRLMLGQFPELQDPQLKPEPTCWELAQRYGDLFRAYRQDRVEADVLAPLGYTTASFHEHLGSIPEAKSIEIMNRMEDYRLEFEAMFLGYDENSEPCILEVDNRGKVTNQNVAGFGSIGNGGLHADAHMRFIGYEPYGNQFDALWDVFCAKKRAEAAPGVGKETDLLYVTALGYEFVGQQIVDKLESLYASSRQAAKNQSKRAARALYELAGKIQPE